MNFPIPAASLGPNDIAKGVKNIDKIAKDISRVPFEEMFSTKEIESRIKKLSFKLQYTRFVAIVVLIILTYGFFDLVKFYTESKETVEQINLMAKQEILLKNFDIDLALLEGIEQPYPFLEGLVKIRDSFYYFSSEEKKEAIRIYSEIALKDKQTQLEIIENKYLNEF